MKGTKGERTVRGQLSHWTPLSTYPSSSGEVTWERESIYPYFAPCFTPALSRDMLNAYDAALHHGMRMESFYSLKSKIDWLSSVEADGVTAYSLVEIDAGNARPVGRRVSLGSVSCH